MTPSLCLQERLLLSLLPAHIARVMKAEIIQRLQGPNFGRTESTNNFHNLYVQRHTNVRWGSFVFASLHFIKVIIFPSHLGVWLLLYHPVLPPSSLLLFSARSHSCSYSMGLLLYSSSSVISLLYSSPLFFFVHFIISTSHLLHIPFHYHGQIHLRVNPPPLCSEVTLPNDEESMSFVLYTGDNHSHKSRLTIRASP